MTNNRLIDSLQNEANKEEFEGNTEALATAAYTQVTEDASTGLTYKLPLEASYAKSLTKKYYSASEVTKHLNIALHQLRYLETKIPDLSNYKINNRKYYTVNDIDLLQKSLKKDITSPSTDKVHILLTNFHNLSLQIKKILADSSMTCV
ncbi:RPE1 domain protein [Rickettsia felis str. Pedreira]|uniref:RPE1 domain protein n=2 Tax=Rickettsia felis TaxID=42862 RepID=A0A0F3MRE7_RICFI|nr:unknown [Rickettsia felis URRWXCal2]KJV58315.1 RPE1 domain protein [Rickettsia felis str. Pedreira]